MTTRTSAAAKLDPVFVDRWSPRSFSPEAVSDEDLAAVFEAARWTPSWMNNQPWLFVYDTVGGANREALEASFMDFNRDWAVAAPVLGLVLSHTELEGFMARTEQFDTGAATMSMAIQATKLGLSMHLLGGIDLDAAFAATGATAETHNVWCGFVLGHRGDASALSEKLQEREAPSDRKPVSEFVFKGAL